MKLGILYATREGQTRRVAERFAEMLHARGFETELVDLAHVPSDFELSRYQAVVLAASVHAGKHEREMISFVQHHRDALEHVHTTLLSLSLTEASVEMRETSAEQRTQAERDVRRMIDQFYVDTGFHPARARPVAGALRYSKYNPVVRLVMKRIAKHAGGSTDTRRDHEYTDWEKLELFADDLSTELRYQQAAEAVLPVSRPS